MKFFKSYKLYILIILFISLSHAKNIKVNEHQKINFLTEPLPPISYSSPNRKEIFGIGVDIIGYIAKKVGHSYKAHAKKQGINIMSWQTSYKLIQENDNYALFPMLKTKSREKLFKWVGPIITLDAYFYRHKNAPNFIKEITSIEQMNTSKVKIGVVKGYPTHLKMLELGYNNFYTFSRTNDSMSSMRIDRVHFVNNAELLFPFRVAKMGFKHNDFVNSKILTFSQGQYIAFSKNTPNHIINKWQKELDNMKKNGTYEKIYRKALIQAIEIYNVVPKDEVKYYINRLLKGIQNEK
jgi:polar amino acid transport system substrate-binding protein